MEELLKPFIRSSKEILTQVGSIQLELKQPIRRKDIHFDDEICVIIGITGTLKGQVILNLPEHIAKQIASNMMGGMPVAILDDMAKSAISELGNMIIGNAAAGLFDMGISIDITPPSILTGKEITYSSVKSEIVCIPLEAGVERIELNIMIKDK